MYISFRLNLSNSSKLELSVGNDIIRKTENHRFVMSASVPLRDKMVWSNLIGCSHSDCTITMNLIGCSHSNPNIMNLIGCSHSDCTMTMNLIGCSRSDRTITMNLIGCCHGDPNIIMNLIGPPCRW